MSTNDATSLDDWELARRAAGGDEPAFHVLFHRYSSEIKAFVKSRIGQADAEDAISEIWLKIWQAIKVVRSETHFRGWIFQIARNHVTDLARRKGRRKSESLSDDPPATDDSNIPDLAFELQEREVESRDCLRQLPSDYRDVTVRFYAGESHDMIAKALQIPVGTSHSRLSRGKLLFKECMERKGWQA